VAKLNEHLRIFAVHKLKLYRAAIIVLYRPYIHQRTYQAPQTVDRSLQALSRSKVKAAAAQINMVLEQLIDLDKVKWIKPLSYVDRGNSSSLLIGFGSPSREGWLPFSQQFKSTESNRYRRRLPSPEFSALTSSNSA
jgi:hypothetical protein